MNEQAVQTGGARAGLMRRGLLLEYFTIGWNLLGGLLLNALFGWWWADPVVALAMIPIIAKEEVEALCGEMCCDDVACH